MIKEDQQITFKYTINLVDIEFEQKEKKSNIFDTLWKYIIKSSKLKKENLSSNVDKILYGK